MYTFVEKVSTQSLLWPKITFEVPNFYWPWFWTGKNFLRNQNLSISWNCKFPIRICLPLTCPSMLDNKIEKVLGSNSFVHEYVSIKDTPIWVSTKTTICNPKTSNSHRDDSYRFVDFFYFLFYFFLIQLWLWIALKNHFFNKYKVCYDDEKDLVVSLSNLYTATTQHKSLRFP